MHTVYCSIDYGKGSLHPSKNLLFQMYNLIQQVLQAFQYDT